MKKSIYTRDYAVLLRVLKQARKQAGMTQLEFAKRLELTQSFVSKIERGDRRIDIVELRTFCHVFGITLNDFVNRLERELTGRK
jgi:transcriptional regulator with XRE-family HTH domain